MDSNERDVVEQVLDGGYKPNNITINIEHLDNLHLTFISYEDYEEDGGDDDEDIPDDGPDMSNAISMEEFYGTILNN